MMSSRLEKFSLKADPKIQVTKESLIIFNQTLQQPPYNLPALPPTVHTLHRMTALNKKCDHITSLHTHTAALIPSAFRLNFKSQPGIQGFDDLAPAYLFHLFSPSFFLSLLRLVILKYCSPQNSRNFSSQNTLHC